MDSLLILYYTSLVISIVFVIFLFIVYVAKYGNHLLTNYFGLVLVFQITTCISILYENPREDMQPWVCTLQGLMITYTNVAFMCWLLCFAVHLYVVMVWKHANPNQFLKYYILFNYILVPLVPCILTLAASNSISYQSLWCWVDSPFWVQLLSVYLITIFAAVTCGLFFLRVLYHLWRHRFEPDVGLHFRNMTTRRIFFFICIFPIYLVLYLYGFISRQIGVYTPQDITTLEFAASFLGVVLFVIFGTRFRTFRQWYLNRATRIVKAAEGPGDTIRALEIIRAEEDIFGVVTGYDSHVQVARRHGERFDWERALDYTKHAKLLQTAVSKFKAHNKDFHGIHLRELATIRMAAAGKKNKPADDESTVFSDEDKLLVQYLSNPLADASDVDLESSDVALNPKPSAKEEAADGDANDYAYDKQKRLEIVFKEQEVNDIIASALASINKESIILEQCGLPTIPEKVLTEPLGTSIKYLYLGNNNIFNVPETIASLVNLTHLELYSNFITKLPDAIADLEKLEVLILSNNKLKTLPTSFNGKLPNLKVLWLNRNLFRTFPMIIFKMANPAGLSQLLIHENHLVVIPSAINLLTGLTVLDVSHNFLKKLPEELGKLPQLREFAANANALTDLPASLITSLSALNRDEDYPPLERLSLWGNRLRSLPAETFYIYADTLRYLNLSINGMRTIPTSVFACSKLTYFAFSGNLLEDVPPAVGKLRNLRCLFLSHNKLEFLPVEVISLKDMIRLELNDNNLKTTLWLPWWYLGGKRLLSLRLTQWFTAVIIFALVQVMIVGITLAYTQDPVNHWWSWGGVLGEGFCISMFLLSIISPVLYVLRNSSLAYFTSTIGKSAENELDMADQNDDVEIAPLADPDQENPAPTAANPRSSITQIATKPRFPILVSVLQSAKKLRSKQISKPHLQHDILGGYRRPVRFNIHNAVAIVLLFVETYQLTSFSFHEVIPWSDQIIATIFRFALFDFGFPPGSWYIFVFCCSTVFVLGVRGVVEGRRFTWRAATLDEIAAVLVTALFIPVTKTLFQSVSCTLQDESTTGSSAEALLNAPKAIIGPFTHDATNGPQFELTCYAGFHIFFPVIGLTAMMLFYPQASMSTAAYQDREEGLDIRYRPSFLAIDQQLKFLLTVITTSFSKRLYVYEAVNIAIIGILLALTVYQRPAIVSVVNYWKVLLLFGVFSTSICSLATAIIDDGNNLTPVWVVTAIWSFIGVAIIVVTALWLWDLNKLPKSDKKKKILTYVDDFLLLSPANVNVVTEAAEALKADARGRERPEEEEEGSEQWPVTNNASSTVTIDGGTARMRTKSRLSLAMRLRGAVDQIRASSDGSSLMTDASGHHKDGGDSSPAAKSAHILASHFHHHDAPHKDNQDVPKDIPKQDNQDVAVNDHDDTKNDDEKLDK